jgi:uncharacterized linocin/CFP29 family protein
MIQNRGRDKISWGKEIWDFIDMAVHDECTRVRVAAKYLPIHQVPDYTTTVPADSVSAPAEEAGVIGAFAVDEGAITRLIEFWVEFSLTPQQLEQETQIANEHRGHSTAVTLATRAANLLMRAEDMIIYQGRAAFATDFFQNNIRSRGVPADFGLLDIIPAGADSSIPELPEDQVITVKRSDSTSVLPVYGENTFKAVAEGYAVLQGKGHYGPYGLTLQTVPFADTHAPLQGTLIMPADRIRPLATAGFYGSGTLAAATTDVEPQFTGSMVSVGGNTVDLVVGTDATTAFSYQDEDGNYRFRVLERLALRLKDISAVVRFEFQ